MGGVAPREKTMQYNLNTANPLPTNKPPASSSVQANPSRNNRTTTAIQKSKPSNQHPHLRLQKSVPSV
jgi:hypothetical protein